MQMSVAPDKTSSKQCPPCSPNALLSAKERESGWGTEWNLDGKHEKRDKWGSKTDFILSCLGYAVGLGNVWRFPYLCGRSGGASFLIPYVIMLIFAGIPAFYLELAIGQYAGVAQHILYQRMCPIFSGIGYTMVVISVITGIYYNMIIAWSIYYFIVSFSSNLPFQYCTNWWNTDTCYDGVTAQSCDNSTTVYFQGMCSNVSSYNETMLDYIFSTHNDPDRSSPAAEYLNNRVLGLSEGIHDIGFPRPELVLALLASWIIIFLCLMKGIKSSGKVVYFTATFPYVILFILMIRGVTLDGAIDGIKFYMIPNFTKLQEGKVWGDAAIQIFFSLSLGGGGLTTLASYNEFHNNIFRDTLIVTTSNCATSIFAGFVIFPILGYLAKILGKTVASIAESGPTLAFIAYPSALVTLPGAQAWAVLFFFMLIMLGIDTQLVIVEVAITFIIDQWPQLRPFKNKLCVLGSICLFSFLLGLVLTCPGGPYIFNLMDTYAGGWTLVMSCLAEVCMVSWAYGFKRLIKDIQMMLGVPPNRFYKMLGYPVSPYWWINWAILTPLLLTLVLFFNFWTYEPATYGSYEYPLWGDVVGWMLSLACAMWIPIAAIVAIIYAFVTKKTPRWLITPTSKWGPAEGYSDFQSESLKHHQMKEFY